MSKLYAGVRLRHLRGERGMSQADLARLLDLSPSYVNQLERDQRPLTIPVLLRLTSAFAVDAEFFVSDDSARLMAEVRDALLDDAVGVAVPPAELNELVTRMPTVARALVTLQSRYREAVEQAGAAFDDRDPTVRPPALQPHEQVRDFFAARENHIAPLDEAAERIATAAGVEPGTSRMALATHLSECHGIRVVQASAAHQPDELRRFDADAGLLRVSSHLRPGQQAFQMATQLAFLECDPLLTELADGGAFTSDQARALARIGLASYFAGALLMPYATFHAAAERERYDVERLADAFGVGFETVCHRLSTLQRPRLRGVPFSFVRVDRAGNVSKRQSATGFHFSRSGGTCPLWSVYEAFAAPGKLLRQVAAMPDGRRYLWIARTVVRKRSGYGMPSKTFAIGLGCELRHATRLVYSNGLDLDDERAATPIGVGCKSCERAACPQRAHPQVGRTLRIDEDRRTFAPYPTVNSA